MIERKTPNRAPSGKTDRPGVKPIVLACAGCSFAGQLAYRVALELDRRGVAEISCLAGGATQKKAFLRPIDRRPVWVIDGCPIECGGGIFGNLHREPNRHIRLAELGIPKKREPKDGLGFDGLIDRICAAEDSVTG